MKKTLLLIAFISILLAPLAAASITVSQPQLNITWCYNSSYTILWTSSGVSGPVTILLRKANDPQSPPVLPIAPSTANDGSFENWVVPNSVPEGNYVIRVRSLSGSPVIHGDSPQFQIKSCGSPTASLTLLTPNGGQWTYSTQQDITWNATNWTGSVQLNLKQNGKFKGIIAMDVPAANGKFPWTVGTLDKTPATPGPGYRVQVVRKYKGDPRTKTPLTPLQDESDTDFVIAAPRMADVEPIHVKEPDEGSIFRYGAYGHPVDYGVFFYVRFETTYPGPFQSLLCDGTGQVLRKITENNGAELKNNNRAQFRLIPSTTPPGTYRIKIQTTDLKHSGVSAKFIIEYLNESGGPMPDLIVCKVFPECLHDEAEQTTWLYLKVQNIGTAKSDMCWLYMYIEGSPQWRMQIPPINPGGTEEISIKEFKFHGSQLLDYSMFVDCDKQVTESNENNNGISGKFPRNKPEPVKCSGNQIGF